MGKIAAKGTLLQIGDNASPENFNTIMHRTQIPGPDITRDMIDATALDSAGGYKEWIASFRDGGEVACNGFLDVSDTDGYVEAKKNMDDEELPRNFKVVLPTAVGQEFAFQAFVSKLGYNFQTTGMAECNITLKITGKPTLQASA